MSAALDIGCVAEAKPRPSPTLRRLLVRLALTMQIPLGLTIAGWLVSYWNIQTDHAWDAVRVTTNLLSDRLDEHLGQVQPHLEELSVQVPGSDTVMAAPRPHATETARVAGANMSAQGLSAGFDAGKFERLFGRINLRAGWTAGFADRRGTVVAHSADQGLVGRPLPAAFAERKQASGLGELEWTDRNGKSMLTYSTRSPVHGWTTFVTVPRAVLMAPVWQAAGKLFLALCMLAALGSWVAMRISRRIALSLGALRQAAHAFPAGRPVDLPRLTFTEAEELGAALAGSGRALQQASAARQHSEQQLAAVLRAAGNAIIVTDSAHRIVVFNDAAEAMFGRSKAEMTGRSLDVLFTPKSWQQFASRCAVAASGASGIVSAATPARSVCVRAGGATFAAEFLVAPFLEPDGERSCTVILRDITERLRSEQSLLAAHRDMQHMNDTFQRTLLKEMDIRMAGIARELHDNVGSTLAGISLLAGSGRSAAADPRLALLLEKIQEQVHAASGSVRQISRGIMPAGSQAGALLEALEQFAQGIGAAEEIRCSVRSRGSFESIAAEVGGHVYRVVQEATANALRHGNATRIGIVLAQAGERCRLTVADNGSGCDLGRLPASHAGMGMKSMRARAAAIDGKLHVRSRPGGGCRVSLQWRIERTST